MRASGIIINGRQFWREMDAVPFPIEEKQINRMADGSVTIEYAYTKQGQQCAFDYMPQEDLDFLLEALKDEMEVEYFETGGTEFKAGRYICTENPEPKIRAWDLSVSPPTPIWTDIAFKLEEI